jgi:hypothetical protein
MSAEAFISIIMLPVFLYGGFIILFIIYAAIKGDL